MSLESALESLAESVRSLANATEALAAVAARGDVIRAVTAATTPPAPKGKGGRTPKAKSSPVPVPSATPKPAAVDPAKPIRYDDILTAITGVADRKGEAAARALLAKFNSADGNPCRGAKQVLPKDYASFIAECAAA